MTFNHPSNDYIKFVQDIIHCCTVELQTRDSIVIFINVNFTTARRLAYVHFTSARRLTHVHFTSARRLTHAHFTTARRLAYVHFTQCLQANILSAPEYGAVFI